MSEAVARQMRRERRLEHRQVLEADAFVEAVGWICGPEVMASS